MYRMSIVLTAAVMLAGCSISGREYEGAYPISPYERAYVPLAYSPPSVKEDPIKGNDPIVGDWITDPNVESVVGDWGSNGGLAPE